MQYDLDNMRGIGHGGEGEILLRLQIIVWEFSHRFKYVSFGQLISIELLENSKCQIQRKILKANTVSHIDAKRFTIIANEMMYEGLMLAVHPKEGLIQAITQMRIIKYSKCWHSLKANCYIHLTQHNFT